MITRNKIYYPKSHIITDLRTDGKEWMLENGTEYIGFYHKYIDGTVLTGAVFNRLESKTLIPYVNLIAQPETVVYDSLIERKKFSYPYATVNLPIQKDFKKGQYTRYFIRKINSKTSADIIEIDKDQFDKWKQDKIDRSLYIATEIGWKLTGPKFDVKVNNTIAEFGVFDSNKRFTQLKDKQLPGLKLYLTDYLEYTVYSPLTSTAIKDLFLVSK